MGLILSHKALPSYLLALVAILSAANVEAIPAIGDSTFSVSPTQPLCFGNFSVAGSGGTVTVGWNGGRSATGGIILLSISPTYQPAIFELKLCPGKKVTIYYPATVMLYGSSGSSITLHIGPTEKGESGSSVISTTDCSSATPLRVGGALEIPAGTAPGSYSGTFSITFIQE